MMDQPRRAAQNPKELTGRFVLFCFLGFFGVVIAMNTVLIRAATTTFGGVETPNAYKTGLAFNREIAAARAQEARHWSVDANLIRGSRGDANVTVTVRDGNGSPPSTVDFVARLAHPADRRRDLPIAMRPFGPGVFTGTVHAEPGQWDLLIDIIRDDERLFRSKSRITLR